MSLDVWIDTIVQDIDTTGWDQSYTLPDVTTSDPKQKIVVKNEGTGIVTISWIWWQTIDWWATVELIKDEQSICLMPNSAGNWRDVISKSEYLEVVTTKSLDSNDLWFICDEELRGENDQWVTGDWLDTPTANIAQKVFRDVKISNFKKTDTTIVEDWVWNTVYVDPVYGNNWTGLRERHDKPFQTVNAGYAAAQPWDRIVVRPWQIVGTVNIAVTKDNIHFHFEDGSYADWTYFRIRTTGASVNWVLEDIEFSHNRTDWWAIRQRDTFRTRITGRLRLMNTTNTWWNSEHFLHSWAGLYYVETLDIINPARTVHRMTGRWVMIAEVKGYTRNSNNWHLFQASGRFGWDPAPLMYAKFNSYYNDAAEDWLSWENASSAVAQVENWAVIHLRGMNWYTETNFILWMNSTNTNFNNVSTPWELHVHSWLYRVNSPAWVDNAAISFDRTGFVWRKQKFYWYGWVAIANLNTWILIDVFAWAATDHEIYFRDDVQGTWLIPATVATPVIWATYNPNYIE